MPVTELRQNSRDRVKSLTPRQREVVRYVALGCNVDEIAAILRLAVSTVDNHKAAAMRTLGVDKSTLLTRLAILHQISPLDDQLSRSEKRRCGRKNDGWN